MKPQFRVNNQLRLIYEVLTSSDSAEGMSMMEILRANRQIRKQFLYKHLGHLAEDGFLSVVRENVGGYQRPRYGLTSRSRAELAIMRAGKPGAQKMCETGMRRR